MGIFVKDFHSKEGWFDRFNCLMYGRPKVGKTRSILRIAANGDYVILLSMDRGTRKAHDNPDLFKGRLAIAYPSGLQEIRASMNEADEMVKAMLSKGVPSRRIWIAVDTVTHLQTTLLAEARQIDIKNPKTKDHRDEFLRDATTQVDYMINLGHMNEIAGWLLSRPVNTVVVALEKKPDREKDTVAPAISGQAYSRFMGDADVILRMTRTGTEEIFHCEASGAEEAGDRSGRLAPLEPANLQALRDKVLGVQATETVSPTNSEASAT